MSDDVILVPVTSVQSDLVTQTDVVVYVPIASKTGHGIVRVGEGLTITKNGVLGFDHSEVTVKEIAKNGEVITPDENKRINIVLDKSDVGLNDVDNTSDLDKPVSKATQKELIRIQGLIKGSENAVSYPDYKTLVDEVNLLPKDVYNVGQSVFIGTLYVPDLWVYDVEDDFVSFEYTNDEYIESLLRIDGTFKVGYYRFSMLETLKVDLSDYVDLDSDQIISGMKTVTDQVGILNSENGNITYIKNIDNNFLITSSDGANIINIDKQSKTFNFYNKPLVLKEYVDGNFVSYTVQQDLTDEQKEIARNNIGAGKPAPITIDSELSDSSTNPVQNNVITNALSNKVDKNSVDAELSSTSTNPVQNKALYAPVTFAESERQKSKNLWDTTKAVQVGYSWQGEPDFNSPAYISCGFIKIKPNTNYIFSYADSSMKMQYSGALFYTSDKTYISHVECNDRTFVTPSNAEYMICQFWLKPNPMDYKDKIQIEQNRVATSFEKFNGNIVRNERNIVRRETIYNMDITFENKTNINGVDYTSGIKIDNDNPIEIPIDTRKVQKVIIWITANSNGNNWFSDGAAPLIIDLRQPGLTTDAQYRGNLLVAPNINNKTADQSHHFYGFTAMMSSWDAKSYGVRNLKVEGHVYDYTVSGSDSVKNVSTSNSNTMDFIRITKVEVEIDVNSN